MGLRGIPEGELHFEGCVIPKENVLVGPGDGFKKLMAAYNGQRLGAATVALGLAQGAYEKALAFVRERRSFPDSDYTRVKNQQLFLKALLSKTISKETLTNPVRINNMVDAISP